MHKVSAGDRVKILDGILIGSTGIVSTVNKDKGTITAMIPSKQIHPADRKKFYAKRTAKGTFVPITLAEGEWEPYGSKRIILPD